MIEASGKAKKGIQRIIFSRAGIFLLLILLQLGLFVVTSDKTIEQKAMGRPADRRRKLYNGRLEICYYQFHGEKV